MSLLAGLSSSGVAKGYAVVERVFERLQHDWIHNVVQPTREHKYDQHLQLHQAELMHASRACKFKETTVQE